VKRSSEGYARQEGRDRGLGRQEEGRARRADSSERRADRERETVKAKEHIKKAGR
jgi:hypothetical protein